MNVKTFAAALVATVAVPSVVAAQSWGQLQYEKMGKRVGPFGEYGTYELTNIISLQSVYGTSTLRDIETTSGSGGIALDGGYIELTTGTTSGSSAQFDTVKRGQYQPGKAAEVGMGAYLVTPPESGNEIAEWGSGDDDNGVFWRYTDNNSDGDFELCVVYERNQSEEIACEGGGEGATAFSEGLGGFDPTSEAAVWAIRFNWYGAGGAEYFIYDPNKNYNGTMREQLVHRFVPADGQAMDDPNLPIFARVDNGSDTTNVELEVGGRRYDIQGSFKPPRRQTGARRQGQSVAAAGGFVPLICVRREDPFPESGRQNSINAFIEGNTIEATNDLDFVYTTGGTLTGASFSTASGYADADSALEYDTSATAISGQTRIAGPFRIEGGKEKKTSASTTKGERIPLIGTDPTCLLGDVSSDSTVDTYLRVNEEW